MIIPDMAENMTSISAAREVVPFIDRTYRTLGEGRRGIFGKSGTAIGYGGYFDKPRLPHFGPVFSSLDCPRKVIHPVDPGVNLGIA
jgi:hypothetical protein